MSINRRVSPISARDISCPACSQVGTYENLVDHFCRSQLGEPSSHTIHRGITSWFSVVKARVNAVTPTHVSLRNARSLKKGDRRRSVDDTGKQRRFLASHAHFCAWFEIEALNEPPSEVRLSSDSSACPCNITDGPERRFLVMASKNNDGQLVANLILPWKKEKVGGLALVST